MTEPKPKRRAMTPARKRRIWDGQRGPDGFVCCGCGCGFPVALAGPGVTYEHVIPFWFAPELDDDGPNVQAWRTECSDAKTNRRGGDKTTIAKTKRQITMRVDVERKPSKNPIRSRGFSDQHRPLKSRNTFATRKRP